MKNFILILAISCISIFSIAQSWTSSTHITSTESIIEIASAIDNDGSVHSFGYFEGTMSSTNGYSLESYGGRDYFLISYTPDGEVKGMLQLGSDMHDFANGGVGLDLEGNIYVTGSFQGTMKYSETDSIESSGSYDLFFAKINNLGDIVWVRNAGKGAKLIYPTTLDVDENGDILLTGSFKDSINIYDEVTLVSDNTVPDFFYAKFEAEDGGLTWIHHAKSLNLKSGNIWDIETTSESYYFTGIYVDSIGFESDTLTPDKTSFNAFLIKTDLLGSIQWHRTVQGNQKEYCYAVTTDDEQNVYMSGYYDSDTLFIDSTDQQIVEAVGNNGSNDIYTIKYDSDGNLKWFRTVGGKGNERVFSTEFFDDKIYLAGGFEDTIQWGGIQLMSQGLNDQDMLTGAFDKVGNYRDANSYSGRNNSTEEARAVFQNGDKLYTVLRSNSDLLVLGDSIYTSTGGIFSMVLGVVGCAPISIDNVLSQNIQTCFGDSTGSLQILASGGFGAPWKYSIDNGLSYEDIAYFADLPAGDYPIVVIDAENCAQSGPTETVSQPDVLLIELISDQLVGENIEIVVSAAGGSPPYTYTLQPDGIVQGFGTFNVVWSDTTKYFVEVNDLNGCGPVATDTLTTSNGIELSTPGVKLFPNPTSGVITLEMPFQGDEATLEVLNLTGQVMVSRQIYSSGGMINETFDISDLAKGMYMLRVDGQTLRTGVVVN